MEVKKPIGKVRVTERSWKLEGNITEKTGLATRPLIALELISERGLDKNGDKFFRTYEEQGYTADFRPGICPTPSGWTEWKADNGAAIFRDGKALPKMSGLDAEKKITKAIQASFDTRPKAKHKHKRKSVKRRKKIIKKSKGINPQVITDAIVELTEPSFSHSDFVTNTCLKRTYLKNAGASPEQMRIFEAGVESVLRKQKWPTRRAYNGGGG